MTERQAQQIRELRGRGQGYKAIASATGLSRDAVRCFCKSNVLDTADSKANDRCPNCGKPTVQPRNGRRKRFYDEECRRAWWMNHPDSVQHGDTAVYHLTCAHCGKRFDSYGNNHRRYCWACYLRS